MKSILICALLLLSCTTVTSRGPASVAATSTRCERMQNLEIHAHRGAWDRPENQMSAFLRGYELGADRIELDVQVSGDRDWRKQLVVAHDVFLRENSCLDAKGKAVKGRVYFHDLTLKQIKSYDCGSLVKVGEAVPGEHVSTLLEVLAGVNDRQTWNGRPGGLNIEVKYNPKLARYYPPRGAYADLLLRSLADSLIDERRVIVQSFDLEFLRELRARNKEIVISPLLEDVSNARAVASELNASLITPQFREVTPELIAAMHDARHPVRVIPWTVNDPDVMLQLVDMGADGLITDRPDIFVGLRNNCR